MEPVQATPLESITRDLLASQLVVMQAFVMPLPRPQAAFLIQRIYESDFNLLGAFPRCAEEVQCSPCVVHHRCMALCLHQLQVTRSRRFRARPLWIRGFLFKDVGWSAAATSKKWLSAIFLGGEPAGVVLVVFC